MAPKVGVDSHQRTLGASMAATTSGAAVASTPTTGPSTSSNRPSSHHHHHQRVSPRKSASATLALRPKPPKKNVRFTDKNDVTLVMCLDEYTEEEADQTWYTVDEYAVFEAECEITADLLDARKPLLPDFCPRGLECWTQEGERNKEFNVGQAIELVWQAQLEYWTHTQSQSTGSKLSPPSTPSNTKATSSTSFPPMEEVIRREYRQITIPCQMQAHAMGLADEKDIASYLISARSIEKTRRKMMTLSSTNRQHRKETFAASFSSPKPIKPALKPQPRIRRSVSSKETTGSSTSARKSSSVSGHHTRTSSNGSAGTPSRSSKRSTASSEPKQRQQQSPLSRNPSSLSPVISPATTTTTSSGQGGTADDDDNSKRSASASASAKTPTTANGKKIVFKPKSKQKVPLSPVGSLASQSEAGSQGSSTVRSRRASHALSSKLSVCSDDTSGSRRRMLRAPPL